jgi:hypothetical protein
MSARICPSCQYNVVSTVVTACPNCGNTLPMTLASASSSSMMLVATALILAGGAGAWYLMRGPAAVAPPEASVASVTSPPSTVAAATPPPATMARSASPRSAATPATPAVTSGASAAIDDRAITDLIVKLSASGTAFQAAAALAEIPSPRAEQALMTAYDRRQWGKMAGAAAFYARKRPPQYETVLVELLNQSRDLAVAQDLILSKDPKLAEPARKWAAEQGFKLVPSNKTPTGVTWVQN